MKTPPLLKIALLLAGIAAMLLAGCSTPATVQPASVSDASTTPEVSGVSYDINDVDQKPVPLNMMAHPPEYPLVFKRKGINGSAIINFIVTAKGDATEVQVVAATQPEFGEAAKAAVERWRYKPAKKNGVAVACWMQIPIEFNLEDVYH